MGGRRFDFPDRRTARGGGGFWRVDVGNVDNDLMGFCYFDLSAVEC